MANKLQTSVVLDLAGNLDAKAKKYGRSFDGMGKHAKHSFGVINRSAAMAGKGLDKIGNRYSGVVAGFASGKLIKNVADFDEAMTRLGTDANISADGVDDLKKRVDEVASSADINLDRTKLAESLSTFLGKTGDIDAGKNNIKNLGMMMQGFGVEAQDAGLLMASFWRNGIRNSKAVEKEMDIFAAQFSKGSVSVKDLAKESAGLMALLNKRDAYSVTKMGALIQAFATTKKGAAEASTSIQAVFNTLNTADKQKKLKSLGVDVFESDGKTLKDQFAVIDEVINKTEKYGDRQLTVLSSVFDSEAISGLRSLLNDETRKLYKDMSKGNAEWGKSLENAIRNANSFGAVLTGLNGVLNKTATEQLSEPLKEFSHWLNQLDKDTLRSGINFSKWVAIVVGSLVAIRKGYSAIKSVSEFGKKGINAIAKKTGGKGLELSVQRVYVVNMPMGGLGSGSRGRVGRSSKNKKGSGRLPDVKKKSISTPRPHKILNARNAARGIGTIATVGTLIGGDAEQTGAAIGGWAGAEGGAALGATIGTAIFPGIGTAIVGALGGLIGGLGGGYAGDKVGSLFMDDDKGADVSHTKDNTNAVTSLSNSVDALNATMKKNSRTGNNSKTSSFEQSVINGSSGSLVGG